MAKKKAFALRIDENLMKALETWADEDFRSANGQIEFLLHRALTESGRLNTNDANKKVQQSESTK